jgi:antitoxin Phd
MMHKSQWRLQDAKAQFSQVVEAALQGEPQHVTRRGRDAVVVLSETSYRRLQQSSHIAAPGFISHLLAVPKTAKSSMGQEKIKLRDVDL